MNEHSSKDRTQLFFFVFLALVMLTIASFATSSHWIPASPNARFWIMVGISVVKATLVVLFFMHFLWESSWKYILTIPAAIMSVFLVFALVPDILYRNQSYSDHRRNYSAEDHRSSAVQLTDPVSEKVHQKDSGTPDSEKGK